MKDGRVTRGWIGVEPNNLSPELAETFGLKVPKDSGAPAGVIITGVLQNGPAAQAGLRPGDVIVSVGGKAIGNVSELLSTVSALKPGTPAKFGVLRQQGQVEIEVTPALRPRPQQTQR